MNEQKARAILGDVITDENSLIGDYIDWSPGDMADINGIFSPDELEAIAWWMRKKGNQ
jgi:hypothetical protein